MTTAAERAHLSKVAALGCIVFRSLGYGATEAECHHIKAGTHGVRATHYQVIPLCHPHHRTGGHGIAIHAGRKTWEEKYGTEVWFLERTLAEVLSDDI